MLGITLDLLRVLCKGKYSLLRTKRIEFLVFFILHLKIVFKVFLCKRKIDKSWVFFGLFKFYRQISSHCDYFTMCPRGEKWLAGVVWKYNKSYTETTFKGWGSLAILLFKFLVISFNFYHDQTYSVSSKQFNFFK